MKDKIIKLLIVILIFCVTNGHEVSATKKAVFPDEKSLQPMPNAYFVHPNVSGNINSTSNILPDQESAPNTTNTKNYADTGPANAQNNGNHWIFYIILCIIISVIFFFYKKFKRK